MAKLKYPFTFEEWLNHKSTIPKLKWIKKISEQIKNDSKQLKLRL